MFSLAGRGRDCDDFASGIEVGGSTLDHFVAVGWVLFEAGSDFLKDLMGVSKCVRYRTE